MVRALLVAIVAVGSTACAPIHGGYGRPGLRAWSSAPAASLNVDAVTGRWDNIMMLPKSARIHVLRMDGTQAEGEIVSASATALKLMVAAGEVEIPADEVARIDHLSGSARKRQALSGAAHGAGFVGFLGLLAGEAPPPRLFAAGALAGAEAGYHAGAPGGPRAVYLAPQLHKVTR
jgi:hypothetical protein